MIIIETNKEYKQRVQYWKEANTQHRIEEEWQSVQYWLKIKEGAIAKRRKERKNDQYSITSLES